MEGTRLESLVKEAKVRTTHGGAPSISALQPSFNPTADMSRIGNMPQSVVQRPEAIKSSFLPAPVAQSSPLQEPVPAEAHSSAFESSFRQQTAQASFTPGFALGQSSAALQARAGMPVPGTQQMTFSQDLLQLEFLEYLQQQQRQQQQQQLMQRQQLLLQQHQQHQLKQPELHQHQSPQQHQQSMIQQALHGYEERARAALAGQPSPASMWSLQQSQAPR
jgi:hypothetical protein